MHTLISSITKTMSSEHLLTDTVAEFMEEENETQTLKAAAMLEA